MEYQEPDKSEYISTSDKIKKVGFVKRCLIRLLKNDIEKEYVPKNKYENEKQSRVVPPRVLSRPSTLEASPMHLKIYPATGGIVIEVSVNDRSKSHDYNASQLHVVNDGTDLGRAIAKIITLEKLRG
jgi:hypothetical protein